jgi:hypothetical protein
MAPRVSRRDCEDADADFPLLHEAEPPRPGLSAVYTPALSKALAPPQLPGITTLYELFQ